MWHYCFFNTWVWKQDDDYTAWAWEFYHAPFPKQDLTVALSLLNGNTFHYATGKMNACVTAMITIWKRIQPEHGKLLSKEELVLKGVPDTFLLPLRQHLTASVQQRNRQGVHPPITLLLLPRNPQSLPSGERGDYTPINAFQTGCSEQAMRLGAHAPFSTALKRLEHSTTK